MAGSIQVTSTPGVGTEFNIFFHRKSDTANNLPSQGPGQVFLPGVTEHILLIDDDLEIVNMVTAMLKNLDTVFLHAPVVSKP